jgi:ABC-type antimicrobial peptide transport system permease subunit
VMAHTVARRTREIGVRLALGESPARVGQQILRGAFGLALGGVAIGVGLSLLLAPQLQSFLSDGLRASDPLTMSVWSAGLILIGVASAIVPARRASRIDPIAALRES